MGSFHVAGELPHVCALAPATLPFGFNFILFFCVGGDLSCYLACKLTYSVFAHSPKKYCVGGILVVKAVGLNSLLFLSTIPPRRDSL